jgi:hypothetical protein
MAPQAPGNRSPSRIIGWLEAGRFVFIRPEDFGSLLKVEGAKRVPEGVAFDITNPKDAALVLSLARAMQ